MDRIWTGVRVLSILILINLFSSGCLFNFGKGPSVVKKESKYPNKVIDVERLAKGGKIFVVHFKPGADIAATVEFDRISLKVIKGIYDTLTEEDSPFKIVKDGNIGQADLIISGYIVKLECPEGLERWIPGKKSLCLMLEGKMEDPKTGRVIVYFSRQKTAENGMGDLKTLGHELGKEIGSFILGHASKNRLTKKDDL